MTGAQRIHRRYAISAKGIARRRRYQRSVKGRARNTRYERGAPAKARHRKYQIRPEVRSYLNARDRSQRRAERMSALLI